MHIVKPPSSSTRLSSHHHQTTSSYLSGATISCTVIRASSTSSHNPSRTHRTGVHNATPGQAPIRHRHPNRHSGTEPLSRAGATLTTMTAFITLTPLRLRQPHLLLSLRPPLSPHRRPRTAQTAPPPPTSALRRDLSVAAFSALAIGLSWLPLISSPSAALASLKPALPQVQLVVSNDAVASRFSDSVRPVSVIGVAKAPIHDYHYDGQEEEVSAAAALDDSINDARREFVMAARLVTSVLLGVMIGIERRATRLNLGVRSITLIAITSALVSVVATGGQVTGIAMFSAAAAVPAIPVAAAGLLAALGLFVAVSNRPRPTKEVVPMCLVVGTVIAMGGACGAGISLMSAGCYLAAIGIMRGTEKNRKAAFAGTAGEAREDRELMVESDDGWDAERRMVLRIGKGQKTNTRVVEVGRQILGEGRLDFDD